MDTKPFSADNNKFVRFFFRIADGTATEDEILFAKTFAKEWKKNNKNNKTKKMRQDITGSSPRTR